MTFVISGKKFPPMWLRSKARYSEVIPNVRFNGSARSHKASQSLKMNLDWGYLKGYNSNELGRSNRRKDTEVISREDFDSR